MRYAPAVQFDLTSHISPFLRNIEWNLAKKKKNVLSLADCQPRAVSRTLGMRHVTGLNKDCGAGGALGRLQGEDSGGDRLDGRRNFRSYEKIKPSNGLGHLVRRAPSLVTAVHSSPDVAPDLPQPLAMLDAQPSAVSSAVRHCGGAAR